MAFFSCYISDGKPVPPEKREPAMGKESHPRIGPFFPSGAEAHYQITAWEDAGEIEVFWVDWAGRGVKFSKAGLLNFCGQLTADHPQLRYGTIEDRSPNSISSRPDAMTVTELLEFIHTLDDDQDYYIIDLET